MVAILSVDSLNHRRLAVLVFCLLSLMATVLVVSLGASFWSIFSSLYHSSSYIFYFLSIGLSMVAWVILFWLRLQAIPKATLKSNVL